MKMQVSSERIISAAFVFSIASLLLIGVISYIQYQSITESQHRVLQSHQIRTPLENLIVKISELESAERAYLISNDSLFLTNYKNKEDGVFSTIKDIRHLIFEIEEGGNSKILVDSLQGLVQAKLQHLGKVIKLHADGHKYEELEEELILGDSLMRKVRGAAKIMGFLSDLTLREREYIASVKNKAPPKLLLIAFFFSLLMFTIAYIKINRDFNEQKKSSHQLEVNQEIFEQAELIADSGHWYYSLDSHIIKFSNNQYRLLRLQPSSFEPNLKSFFYLIAPEDRKLLIESLENLKHRKRIDPIDIRMMTGKGEKKYFRLMAKMTINQWGEKTVIGVNKDLTKIMAAKEKLYELNKELEIQNHIYKNAEAIGNIGSFSLDCVSGKLILSDHLCRLLGYHPDELKVSLEQFLEMVHQDDRVMLKENFICREDDIGTRTNNQFRILKKEGEYIYISFNRKVLKEDWGRVLIVVFRDITQETLTNQRLKERNLELKKTNAQLESFNHVASHDLQEPLRKIQTFVSRIDQEDINLSPLTLDYFDKIQKSAKRMQNLILDLLTFSKVSKIEKEFKKASLRKLLESAIRELAQDIQEKNASLQYDLLPEAMVIPFRIKQLFINLLSNSLKYSKSGSPLCIRIINDQVTDEELAFFKNHQGVKLIKISVVDNGIGFEQVYAENIFLHFQRLHGKSEYSGTGMGLAICKKIIENHSGIISAKGIPGQGANFSFVIPENPLTV